MENTTYRTETENNSVRLTNRFVEYKSARENWAKRFQDYEEMINNDVEGTGTQFNVREKGIIEEKGIIAISSNIGYAIKEQMLSFLTSAKPSVTCVPVGNSSKPIAYVFRELIIAALYLTKYERKIRPVFEDAYVGGSGYLHVSTSNFYDYNSFNISANYVYWKDVYPDPFATFDLQDSETIFIARIFTKTKAKKLYNLTEAQIADGLALLADGEKSRYLATLPTTTGQDLIWVHEIYEKETATLYTMSNGIKTFDKPPDEPYIDVDGVLQGSVANKVTMPFVKKYIKVGNTIVSEEMMPITIYPLLRYYYHDGRFAFKDGVMHYVNDIIAAINKAIAITLDNAQKSSNGGWIGPTGAVNDISKWEKDAGRPGHYLEFDPDETLANSGKPEKDLPLPLNQGWFQIYSGLIELVKYITGVFDLMVGNQESAPRAVGVTDSLQNMGAQRTKMYGRAIDDTNVVLGNLIVQFFQAYAPNENIIRYINESEAMVEIMTNVKARIESTPEGQRMIQDDYKGQMGTVIKNEATRELQFIMGDMTTGDYNVRMQSTSNLPTSKQMVIGLLSTLMSRMSNDSAAVAVLKMMLKLSDYPETDQLMREIQQNTNLQQQMQQMNEQLQQAIEENKKLTSEVESLTKENIGLTIENKLDNLQGAVKLDVEKLKTKLSKEANNARQSKSTK